MNASLRAKILLIATSIVIAALAITVAVTFAIVNSNEQKTIVDNLDAVAYSYALTVNEGITSRMAMVTATSPTIAVEDKPTALVMVNQVHKAG